MNIMELKNIVDRAIARGIDPDTTVVMAADTAIADWAIVDVVHDPADPANDENGFIWFTLIPGEAADGRFTPGHFSE